MSGLLCELDLTIQYKDNLRYKGVQKFQCLQLQDVGHQGSLNAYSYGSERMANSTE